MSHEQNDQQAMSLIAMEFYGHPEKQLKLLAFTGTKGKTTAAYFAYHILEQSHRPAMLSTMNTTLDGKKIQTLWRCQGRFKEVFTIQCRIHGRQHSWSVALFQNMVSKVGRCCLSLGPCES